MLKGQDLSEYVKQLEQSDHEVTVALVQVPDTITRPVLMRIQATLQKAQEMMDVEHTDVMLVTRASGDTAGDVCGVLPRDAIESNCR
ncbi:MAG: hypothetical protein DRQ37_00845 [Gammaproteobacteria bacterium]|nr:MAG: hypothetical protein DRQ37_00845 [Gammaproteobacteria bacterium]